MKDLNFKVSDQLLFLLLMELLELQRLTFQKDLRGEFKMMFNNFESHFSNVRTQMHSKLSDAEKEWVDNMSAAGWESIDALIKAKDPRTFLAVAQLFNEGQICDEDSGKPANEMTFEEFKENQKAA